ncbi:penicillin-binding protein 2 [Desulfosediminicola ganghwensis]|uniref:penicillin-binding protein 2 n=1 Tax=Desulfosediminicola ganghwensis TaxID=2569540 RepID=UPI0010AD42C7|nr:penicillin-binding protein 2 [Desulfosediminicola ganghwensis]
MKLFFKEVEEFSERDEEAVDLLRRRLLGGVAVIIPFFSIIISRLWSLQILHGDDYKEHAYSNRVRVQEIAAPRGHILDRKGREIVTNRPSFNVVLMREDSHDIEEVLKRLAPVLKEDISLLWERIRKSSGVPRYLPITLKEDIDWQTLAYIENHNQEFPGIRIEVKPVRVYEYGNLASNTIGYLGVISKAELEKSDQKIYSGTDLVGKQGLEKLREADLRGGKGHRYIEVDARGFERKQLKQIDPLPGNQIYLTIDAELQKVAENLMDRDERAGAVVAMEVKTGRLLVLATTPSIVLDQFIGGISHKNWNALRDNPQHPLLNKIVQANYPPGSTYKMVIGLAGLAKGLVDRETKIYCPGHYSLGNKTYRCWKHSGHGSVNLEEALEQSCDVYFYQLGQWLGVDTIAEYAKKFGLGEKTGVEMEHEKSGLVPTKNWKRQRYGERWHDGETVIVAIGQGYNLATPIQLTVMTAALAANGKRMQPQLIEKVVDPSGEVTDTFEPIVVADEKFDSRFMDIIHQGMVDVVHGKKGTARKIAIDGLTIAGKTGTSQVVRVAKYRGLKDDDIPYNYRDHALFTCYAPADDPEIALTVIVEHGLGGSSTAAPIAKVVLEKYFEDYLNELQANEEKENQA